MADIYGTNNDDTLNGTSGADLIDGLDGNDIINGGDGNDTINGGDGNDYLYGEGGDDEMYGQLGNNHFYGGEGNDSYHISRHGNNILYFGNDWGNDSIYSDDISSIKNTLDFTGYDGNITINASSRDVYSGSNILSWEQSFLISNIYGGNGDDILTTRFGGEIHGGNGSDLLSSSSGGFNGITSLYGGVGDDSLIGSSSETDKLIGGTGNDTMIGRGGADIYYLSSDSGHDTIYENGNYSFSNGGDQIRFSFDSSLVDVFTAQDYNGDGNLDQLYLGYDSSSVTINNFFDDTSLEIETSGFGNGSIEAFYFNDTSFTIVEFIDHLFDLNNIPELPIGAITGDENDNSLNGTSNDDYIYGLSGDDTIYGLGGNDSLYGGDGDDTIYSGTTTGTKEFYGGNGNDTLVAGTSINDLTTMSSTIHRMFGGYGDDVFYTNEGSYDFHGGRGNDTYYIGEDGQYAFIYEEDWGTDNIIGDPSLSPLPRNARAVGLYFKWNYDNFYDDLTINMIDNKVTQANNLITWTNDVEFQFVHSGNGNDIIYLEEDYVNTYSGGFSVQVEANDGNDIVYGSNSHDKIDGGFGNDELYGFGGDDHLYGDGRGIDLLLGGSGNDTYYLRNGNSNYYLDTINDESGNADVLRLESIYELNENNILAVDTDNNGFFDRLQINNYGTIENYFDNTVEVNTGSGLIETIRAGNNYYAFTDILSLMFDTVEAGTSGEDTLSGNAQENHMSGNDGNDTLYGHGGNDSLYGGVGNDFIDGGAGHDVMAGGEGDDVYVLDSNYDTAFENSDEGTDTVLAYNSYAIGDNIERLRLQGSDNLGGSGNTLDNALFGNSGNNLLDGKAGNDYLDGGAGDDIMIGGYGDDTYVVDSVDDVVTEVSSAGGVDYVISSVNYTLGNNLESLRLNGTNNLDGTGNSLNNTMYGNSGVNTLDGGTGNDYLDGGANADTLIGGLGDDTYIVDNAGDVIVENSNEGIDTVHSSVDYILDASLENLRLSGTANRNGTGNASDNNMYGNSGRNTLTAGEGNDLLDGGAGMDVLIGGAGDDTYYVDTVNDVVTENSGEGIDTVYSTASFILGDNIENIRLLGTTNINSGGNDLDNTMTGNSGNNILDGGDGNDVLDGGLGTDTLIGGTGDDWYYIRNSNDVITENAGEGDTDYAFTYVDYVLGDNVERMRMFGATHIDGTGNASNNALYGNYGNNTLSGLDGNDFIDGGAGGDTMLGGLGDDTFVVDSVLDTVTENAGEGTDTVLSHANYTLGDNLERLRLQGSANLNATGNSENNILFGNSGDNRITGGAGDDGLNGLAGNDTFVFELGSGNDLIGDFENGSDLIDISGWNITDFNDLLITEFNGDTTITFDGATDSVVIDNTASNNIDASDFIFAQGLRHF